MKYQIKPITVDALRVVGVGEHMPNDSIRVLLEGQGPTSHGTVVKRTEMLGLPKVGDYLVTNEDGTRNLIPKAPFEATHTAVESQTLGELETEGTAEEGNVEEVPSEAELRAEDEQAEQLG